MFKANVEKFVKSVAYDLQISGLTEERIGHSLWLTHNRHGAGFNDYSMSPENLDGETITVLVNAANELKELHLYARRNKIYCE